MTKRPGPPDRLPDEFAALGAMVAGAMGFLPNSLKTMARRPALLQAVMPLLGFLGSPANRIEPGLRQMVGYMASFGAGCRYCQAHTSHAAGRQGVSAGKVADLWRFETSELFDARERAALHFAFATGQVPNAVDESHYARLADHFDEEEVLDLAAIAAIFGFLNRWNDTLGTPLEEGPASFAGRSLQQSGWEIGKHG